MLGGLALPPLDSNAQFGGGDLFDDDDDAELALMADSIAPGVGGGVASDLSEEDHGAGDFTDSAPRHARELDDNDLENDDDAGEGLYGDHRFDPGTFSNRVDDLINKSMIDGGDN